MNKLTGVFGDSDNHKNSETGKGGALRMALSPVENFRLHRYLFFAGEIAADFEIKGS